MKLKFDANQDYQIEAIQSIVDIFEGQPLEADDLQVEIGANGQAQKLINDIVVGNKLLIDDEQIASNTTAVQDRNGIQKAEISKPFTIGVSAIGGPDHLGEGTWLKDGRNFTVEMETGTGKTYVYLRTIHELYKTYGFKKFIIVVPSIAIKEGVLKNLEVTRKHFATLYGNPKLDWYVWDPKKRGQMRAFATNDGLQILVINIDSFAKLAKDEAEGAKKKQNIIYQESDWGKPIEYIRATNPIVIVDEPQNMETEVRKRAIEQLNPLCTLRYSATHKYPYNMVYKLDPVQAYDRGLVKKIEVDSVFSEDSFNAAYIKLLKIERKGKSGLIAHIEVDKDDARGLQRQVLKLQSGDLEAITGRSIYSGYILSGIDAQEQMIEFDNGKTFYVGQSNEGLREELIKYQIQRTIENHFEKEKRLKGQGIKVLSLFFIDRVANYREYGENGQIKGKFAKWFEEAYRATQAKPKYADVLEHDASDVHDGYFSADKGKQWKDTGGDTAADDSTYVLIMKDKERLLDESVPLRFIFSHSALREGWDNPNVFQICTLNETTSEIKKRQEIGRGLRLPVNSEGDRVRDERVNILTVIANESYEDFAQKLQGEIEEETGVEFKGRIKNKADRRRVKLTKNLQLDPSFKEIWDRIKFKTRYQVQFSPEELINKAAEQLAEIEILKPRIASVTARLEMTEEGIETEVRTSSGSSVTETSIAIPDVLGKIQQHTKLTRPTVFAILKQANKISAVLTNPQQVIDETTRIINQVMQTLMTNGIKYEKIAGEEWSMQLFDDKELELYVENLAEVQEQNKTIYDYVAVDSDIERNFAHELEVRDDVKFYFKLPPWFKIDTPLGGYNPDWAIVFEGDSRIYFVAETKGTNNIEELTPSERLRILSGRAHFQALEGIVFKGPVKTFKDITATLSSDSAA